MSVRRKRRKEKENEWELFDVLTNGMRGTKADGGTVWERDRLLEKDGKEVGKGAGRRK